MNKRYTEQNLSRVKFSISAPSALTQSVMNTKSSAQAVSIGRCNSLGQVESSGLAVDTVCVVGGKAEVDEGTDEHAVEPLEV